MSGDRMRRIAAVLLFIQPIRFRYKNGNPLRGHRREAIRRIGGIMLNGTVRKFMVACMSLISAVSMPAESFADSLTMMTWYPAPGGVYQSLITTGGSPSSPVNTMTSILLEAMKQQQTRMNAQNVRIESLEKELKSLQKNDREKKR